MSAVAVTRPQGSGYGPAPWDAAQCWPEARLPARLVTLPKEAEVGHVNALTLIALTLATVARGQSSDTSSRTWPWSWGCSGCGRSRPLPSSA